MRVRFLPAGHGTTSGAKRKHGGGDIGADASGKGRGAKGTKAAKKAKKDKSKKKSKK